MEGNRRRAPIGVPELLVGTTLPHFHKAQCPEDGDYLARLEHGNGQGSIHLQRLECHQLGLKSRLAVLEEHADYFAHICAQFFERFALGVGPRPPGDTAHKQAGIRTALD